MSERPPAFLFYPNDFSADGKVEAMTTEQVGGYILLLCKAWWEDPAGSLPNDDSILARWARMDEAKWAEGKSAVLAPFTLGQDGRWHQKRMRSEWEKLYAVRKRREKAAKIGASERWMNKRENANRKAIASESHANRMRSACISSSSSNIYTPPCGGEMQSKKGDKNTPPSLQNPAVEKKHVGPPGGHPPTSSPPRPRNPFFDALVDEWGQPATKSERSRFGSAAKQFSELGCPPSEIKIRAARYRLEWPECELTPEALLKHWTRFNGDSSHHGKKGKQASSDASLDAEIRKTKQLFRADQQEHLEAEIPSAKLKLVSAGGG